MVKFEFLSLVLFLLVSSCFASTCGSNCPSNTCTNCICGNSKSTISVSSFCNIYSWDQNCCKCIASRISNTNQHFMADSRYWFQIGVMGIDYDDADDCNLAPKDLCSYKNNAKCAYEQYVDYGKNWWYWEDDAFACGCPIGNTPQSEYTEKQRKHIEKVKQGKQKKKLIINQ